MASLLCYALAVSVLRAVTSAYADCPPGYPGDGWCDPECNIPQFAYDRGDCCESNCTSGAYECGSGGYDCRFLFSPDCRPSDPGDGYCDRYCNRPELLYDLGDCCEGDCVPARFPCGRNGYDCVFQYAGSNCPMDYPGDGFCDPGCNNEWTLFDLGDCCISTCTSAKYPCTDSDANCIVFQQFTCNTGNAGNGICDRWCDNPFTLWDKQDCCEETCDKSTGNCGTNGYSCQQVPGFPRPPKSAEIQQYEASVKEKIHRANLGAKVKPPPQTVRAHNAGPQQTELGCEYKCNYGCQQDLPFNVCLAPCLNACSAC